MRYEHIYRGIMHHLYRRGGVSCLYLRRVSSSLPSSWLVSRRVLSCALFARFCDLRVTGRDYWTRSAAMVSLALCVFVQS